MQFRARPLIARRRLVCSCCAGTVVEWLPVPAVLALPTVATAQEPGNPRVVAVEKAPFHLPVFSNEYVTLLNVTIPSGATSGYHKHSIDTASVVVEAANVRVQVLGEAAVDRQAIIGTSSYSAWSKKPLIHDVTNIDSKPFRVVLFEIMYSNPGQFSPTSRAEVPEYKAELDERVRAWRLVLAPGQSVPTITQRAPGVRIVVNGGMLVESESGQPDRAMSLQRGDFFWQEANATRGVRNAGNTQIELVEFEPK